MNGEDRGHKSAAPRLVRYAIQREKEQEGGGEMECNVHEVLQAGIPAEQTEIQHVRNPGEREPIGVEEGGEGPCNVRGCKTRLHSRVLVNVLVVVISNVTVGRGLRVDGQSGQHQQQADDDRTRPR